MSDLQVPRTIPSQSQNSIFHQAATASVFAPLIGIGVMAFLSVVRNSADHQSQQSMAVLVDVVVSIIVLLGLACAIFALCGIPMHGTKGILAKALCGIAIPGLLALIAIPNFMAARAIALKNREYAASPEGKLKAVADQINKEGKKQIDAATRLEGAEALPNRTLVYNYSLVTKAAAEIPDGALDQAVRPNILKTYRTHPDMKFFRENGVTLKYRYRDKNGDLIGDVSVGPADIAK